MKPFSTFPGLGPQGEALYVNGLLAPDLYLRRGRTYTVVVETGRGTTASSAFHPLYITTDPEGGYQVKKEIWYLDNTYAFFMGNLQKIS